MRNFITLFLACAVGLGTLISSSSAQPATKKSDDPAKVLADLLKNVKQKEPVEARVQAVMGLADFGAKAEPALADLLDALQTKNEDLRLNAAIVLAKIGTPAVKPVSKLLESADLDTKFYAIWTIAWIGPDAIETVPAMIKLMSDKNEGVRRKAAYALGRLAGEQEQTIAVLVAAFKDENDEARQAAGEALARFGKAAVAPLIGLLQSDNSKARHQASIALGEIGSDAKDAVPLLKDRFLAKENADTGHYAQVLAKIGKAGVPALEAGFKDSRDHVRQAAAQAMATLGGDAVGILVDGLGDKNVAVRRLAAQTLWPMRIGDKSVVIALAFSLSDDDDQVRQMCMNGLAQLGPQAKLGAAKIKDALIDLNPIVRTQAYYLLSQIGENPRPTLSKALESKDAKVRINTASLMVNVNFDVNAAMPILVEALMESDLGLKMQAASTLAQRNLQTDKVLPIFVDGIKHPSTGVRIQAAQGLGQLGSYGKSGDVGVKALLTALRDPEGAVRQQSLYALQNQRGDLSKILPDLVQLTKDKEFGIRQQVVWLFQRAGSDGVPHLAELLKDSDANVLAQVIQVLRNMGPKATAKALPAIKEAIKDSSSNVRINAMLLLATSGSEGPEFFLKMFQEEKDANLRSNFLTNLTYSGQQKLSLPLLKPAMADTAPLVRQQAINLIGFFGPNSKEGFEIFALGLKDADQSVRTQAAYQGRLYGQKSWPPLEEALKSAKDSGFRQAILQGMQNAQYRSKTSLTPLIDCLKDSNPNVRSMACNVLANIGPDAAEALPQLRELTKDANAGTQQSARNALARIEGKK